MCNLLVHVSVRTTRLISWSCFWGMPSAAKVPSRPFMSGFPPLQTSSWRSLSAIVCRIVRPSRVFSPPLIRQRWRHCARSFKTICWHEAHSHQFLGTFGGAGNGDYRAELKRAIQVMSSYATTHKLLPSQILVRLDGLYGNAAVLREALETGL